MLFKCQHPGHQGAGHTPPQVPFWPGTRVFKHVHKRKRIRAEFMLNEASPLVNWVEPAHPGRAFWHWTIHLETRAITLNTSAGPGKVVRRTTGACCAAEDALGLVAGGLLPNLSVDGFLSDEAKRFMDLRKEDAVLLPLRGKGGLSDCLRPFLRPELRSFSKTIDGLVNKPDMAWREKLKLVKDNRWTKHYCSTLGQRSIQEGNCHIKRCNGKVRRRSTP